MYIIINNKFYLNYLSFIAIIKLGDFMNFILKYLNIILFLTLSFTIFPMEQITEIQTIEQIQENIFFNSPNKEEEKNEEENVENISEISENNDNANTEKVNSTLVLPETLKIKEKSSTEIMPINKVHINKTRKLKQEEKNHFDNKLTNIREIENDKTNRISALGSAMGAIDLGSTPTKKLRFGAGVGNSSSNQAVAVGVGYAPTENFKINTKFSTSTTSIKNNGISIGASYDLDL